MSDEMKAVFDLPALVKGVEMRPAPASCEEIASLLSSLPLWSSFINTSPKPEQKRAFELLCEKAEAPTAEELLYMAEIFCGKYHRIRKDGDVCCFSPEQGEEIYRRYYEMTSCLEVNYILDHFEEFSRLCGKSVGRRQRHDDFAPYRDDPISTSRDPDSSEWKS